MKRAFDILLSLLLIVILIFPIIIISIVIFCSSKLSILYWSQRIGRKGLVYKMPKFRSMHDGVPIVATHLLKDSDKVFTKLGSFLRRTSIDELPQLYSVLKGDMSLVGPRPALFNQYDLIELRNKSGINQLLPGITGWAQVNGRDELSIKEKVDLDIEYLGYQSLWFDLKILFLTFLGLFKNKNISH